MSRGPLEPLASSESRNGSALPVFARSPSLQLPPREQETFELSIGLCPAAELTAGGEKSMIPRRYLAAEASQHAAPLRALPRSNLALYLASRESRLQR